MSILIPEVDSRIGIVTSDEGFKTSSIIVAVETSDDSPFWSIHFGKKIDNGDGPTIDDRGTVVIEETMIRDIIDQIDCSRERIGVEQWIEYR